MKFARTVILSMALFGTMLSCSQKPVVQEYADTASPSEELSRFDADMRAALANQVDVLAPKNFSKADEAWEEAREETANAKDADDNRDALHQIAVGRAYLNRANEFAAASRSAMEEVVTARQQAVAAGAPQIFAKDFQVIESDLKDVTGEIEDNDPGDAAKYRAKLQQAYLEIELKSIKEANLSQARAKIERAKKEDADELAPRTLAIAEKSYKDTEAFITGSRHDQEQIKKRSAETLAHAEHVLKIARDAKNFEGSAPEETALRVEMEQGQLAAKQNELAAEKGVVSSLSAAKQTLEMEQAFNRNFEKAQAEFSKEEAEVYKQGNALMIRLRGLEFPSAKADLKKSNFALLAKVQKVIKDFGDSSVVVEGHTDSVGGKATNERLSTARAESVKEYLVSNQAIPEDKVRAVGYGYQKPLASNKTASGRAQNRRVDIVIQPQPPSPGQKM